jgi:glutathione S-transferase
MLESMLTSSPNGGQFLCGDKLTAADILMSFPLMASKGRAGLTKAVYPKIWDYVDRLSEEGGFKKSVQKIIEVEGEFKASL